MYFRRIWWAIKDWMSDVRAQWRLWKRHKALIKQLLARHAPNGTLVRWEYGTQEYAVAHVRTGYPWNRSHHFYVVDLVHQTLVTHIDESSVEHWSVQADRTTLLIRVCPTLRPFTPIHVHIVSTTRGWSQKCVEECEGAPAS